MKVKTSKLTDAALDWAVLKALKPNLKDPKLAGIHPGRTAVKVLKGRRVD